MRPMCVYVGTECGRGQNASFNAIRSMAAAVTRCRTFRIHSLSYVRARGTCLLCRLREINWTRQLGI